MTSSVGEALGAYGFQLRGLNGAEELLVPAPPSWPTLEVAVRGGSEDYNGAMIDGDHADLELIDGIVAHLKRSPAGVTFVTPQPLSAQALVHPFLSGVVPVLGYWQGWESFHGGAFIAGGKAWGILADREGGKSTTLAWMAESGFPVLSDDVVMLAQGQVLAGPRSIDLREMPGPGLGSAEALGVVGRRSRWRVRLGTAPPVVPLGGWFFLRWSGEASARRLSGADVLKRLAAARSLRLAPPDPSELVRVSAPPSWEIARSRRPEGARRTAELIREAVGGG